MVDKEVSDQLHALVEATNKGKPKPTEVEELKRLLSEHPEVWRNLDLAHNSALRAIKDEVGWN